MLIQCSQWVSTCVVRPRSTLDCFERPQTAQGHRNRKAFTLFLTYATVLSFYCGISATLALLSFVEEAGSADFTPISWAFLMLLGGILCVFFDCCSASHRLASIQRPRAQRLHRISLVAGLEESVRSAHSPERGGNVSLRQHRTTLENMESSNRLRFAPEPDRPTARYRSDYGLSREERRKLNKAASRLNLFDLGWRRNLEQIFGPPTANGTSPFGWAGWLLPSGPVCVSPFVDRL